MVWPNGGMFCYLIGNLGEVLEEPYWIIILWTVLNSVQWPYHIRELFLVACQKAHFQFG